MNVNSRATTLHSQPCHLEVKSYLVTHPLSQDRSPDWHLVLYPVVDRVANSKDPPLVYQVDQILVAIDSLIPEELHNQGINNPSSNFIGGFGVFDPNGITCASPAGHVHELLTTDHAAPPEAAIQPATLSVDQPSEDASQNFITEVIGNDTEVITAQASDATPCLYPFMQIPQISQVEDEACFQQIEQLDSVGSRGDNVDHFQQLDFSKTAFRSMVPQPLSAKYLSPKEYLLLQYYTTRVVHVFPALDSPKSPWVTFHLPRVLQSLGEITVRGTTSPVRAALRSTLLSISAFFLSKEMRSQLRSEESTKWETEAMHFHGCAMNILKGAVNAKSLSQERPKYKELLATMLSMVSINVSSIESYFTLGASHIFLLAGDVWRHLKLRAPLASCCQTDHGNRQIKNPLLASIRSLAPNLFLFVNHL